MDLVKNDVHGLENHAAITVVRSRPRAFVAAVIGFTVAMIDGYDTLALSFIAPVIAGEWTLAPSTVGWIFAFSYAGAALGATIVGILSDRFGRKMLLLISLLIAGTLTILCAWARGPIQLMILRALAGIGLGGAIPTIVALTAQHAQPEKRNAAVTRIFLGYPIGAIVGGAVTAAVVGSVGWRGVLIGGGLCALLLLIPVVLGVARDGERGAESSGQILRPLTRLLSNGQGVTTALFCGAVFLMLLTSYFLVSWTPVLLSLNGVAPQRAAMAGVLLNLGGVLGALILSFIIGRKSPVLAVAVALFVGAIIVVLFGQVRVLTGAAAMLWVFAIGALAAVPSSIAAIAMTALFVRRIK